MSGAEFSERIMKDRMDPERASALLATLGNPNGVNPGDPLPPFFHQIYFWEVAAPGDLGTDGHQKLGGFIPDVDLPNRMWAGGQLTFHAPLHAGIAAEKSSRVEGVQRKSGRTGELAFVSVRHEIRQRGGLVVSERQNLVYRGHGPAGTPPIEDVQPDATEEVNFNTTMLFRYSALTFNGHRIHYDIDYCREVEGYPGLVVHGPLLAQLLLIFAQKTLSRVARFSFRATAPLFHYEPAMLCAKGSEFWVRGPDGRTCMRAEVHPA